MKNEDGKTMTSAVHDCAHNVLVRDGRKANPSDLLKIGHMFAEGRIKSAVDSKIVDYLRFNRDLLPMFAAPGMPMQNV